MRRRGPALGGLHRDERGGVAVIAAAATGVIVVCAALAIDLGSIYLQSRQLQGMADLAAIGAARDMSHAQAAALATANGNGWNGPLTADVVLGAYTADPTIAPAQRFQTVRAANAANAVKVTLHAKANVFFGASILGASTVDIDRTATAAQAQLASFSIGSRLLAVQGGVANAVLSGLTGSQVSLSVMDYNSLASAKVDLLQYSQALQTKLNLTGVSYDKVLQTQMSSGTALSALADTLSTNGNDPAAAALRKIAAGAGNATPAQLDKVIDLGPYGAQDHSDAATGAGVQVTALDLTNAVLQVSQGGHQVALTTNTAVPGLAKVTGWLAIGQRPSNSPWLTVNDDDSVTISTVQTRLYVTAQVAPGAGALSNAGVASVNIPIFVEAASAKAKLSSLTCPASSTAPAMNLLVQPSVGQIAVGEVDQNQLADFTHPVTINKANLVATPALSVTAKADVNIGGLDWQKVSFSQADVQAQAVKTVTTNDIASATVTSLLSNLNLGVQVFGLNLGLGTSAITQAMTPVLNAAAAPLDSTINTLESLTGVKLGQADIWANGLRCQDAALVA